MTLARQPVAMIGGSEASDAQYNTAFEIAAALAGAGYAVICGGRTGVMDAACKGADTAGGTSLAVLPGLDPDTANAYASVVLPTVLGDYAAPLATRTGDGTHRDISRNLVIVGAGRLVVAVGGAAGTANEMKLALQLGRTLVAVGDAPEPQSPETGEPPLAGEWHRVETTEASERIFALLKGQTATGR